MFITGRSGWNRWNNVGCWRLTLIDVDDENDGLTTLREAVAAAVAGNTVDFAPALSGGTITLDRVNLGQISFGKSLTIDASELPAGITIDGDDPTPGPTGDGIRIFNITDSTFGSDPPLVTMIGLTLTGADPEWISLFPQGGAIRSEAMLTLQDMVIADNQAGSGGGVYLAVAAGGNDNRDVLEVENSIFENNSALGSGGSLFLQLSSTSGSATQTARIVSSTLTNNTAGLPENVAGAGDLGGVRDLASTVYVAVILSGILQRTSRARNHSSIRNIR